ncbi:hypothetical protein BDC45DRAFT_542647 [Circinella umbellata]|nr:hypothetical protein BDC45DRAFT_542647 [Circinella umbellata]
MNWIPSSVVVMASILALRAGAEYFAVFLTVGSGMYRLSIEVSYSKRYYVGIMQTKISMACDVIKRKMCCICNAVSIFISQIEIVFLIVDEDNIIYCHSYNETHSQ